MALKLEKSLAGLPYIKNANNVGVLGKSSKQMGIVRRRGKTKQRRRVSHGLLRLRRAVAS